MATFVVKGKNHSIFDDGKTVKSIEDGFSTCYSGELSQETGHSWSFKYVAGDYVRIGIDKSGAKWTGDEFFTKGDGYAYSLTGGNLFRAKSVSVEDGWMPQGDDYEIKPGYPEAKPGDTCNLSYDPIKQTLNFSINGEHVASIANIAKGAYRMAVGTYNKDAEVQLLQYAGPAQEESKEESEALQNEVAALKKEREQKDAAIEQLKKEKADLEKKSEQELQAKEAQLQQNKAEIDKLTAQKQSNEEAAQSAQRQHKEETEKLKQQNEASLAAKEEEVEQLKRQKEAESQKFLEIEQKHQQESSQLKDAVEELKQQKQADLEQSQQKLKQTEQKHQQETTELKDLHEKNEQQLAEQHKAEKEKSQAVLAAQAQQIQKANDLMNSNVMDADKNVLKYQLSEMRQEIAKLRQKLKQIKDIKIEELTQVVEEMKQFEHDAAAVAHGDDTLLQSVRQQMTRFEVMVNNTSSSITNIIDDNDVQPLLSVPTVQILSEINEIEQKSTQNIQQNKIIGKNHQITLLQQTTATLKRVKAKHQSKFNNLTEWSSTYLCDRYPLVAQGLLVHTALVNLFDSYIDQEECDSVFVASRWCVLMAMFAYLTWIGYKTSQYRAHWKLFFIAFWTNYVMFILIMALQLSLPPVPCYLSDGDVSYIPLSAIILCISIVLIMRLCASPTVRYHFYKYYSDAIWYSHPITAADADLEDVEMNEYPDLEINDYIEQIAYTYVANVGLQIKSIKLSKMDDSLIGKREQTAKQKEEATKQVDMLVHAIDAVDEAQEEAVAVLGTVNAVKETVQTRSPDMAIELLNPTPVEEEAGNADQESDVEAEDDDPEEKVDDEDDEDDDEDEKAADAKKVELISFADDEYCTKAVVFYKKNIETDLVLQITGIAFITNKNEAGYMMGQKYSRTGAEEACVVAEAMLISPKQTAADLPFALSRIMCYDHTGCITGVQMVFVRLERKHESNNQD